MPMKERTSAKNIFCEIIIVLNSYNLNLYKMVEFTSDSAEKNGVVEKLIIKVKKENPKTKFWILHCIIKKNLAPKAYNWIMLWKQ